MPVTQQDLPRFHWFALVERTPLVVLSTRTYCFKEFSSRSSKDLSLPDGPAGIRRVLASAREHGLKESTPLPEVEKAHLRTKSSPLDGYKTAYLREKHPESDLQPMDVTQEKISQHVIVHFLATRMAPKLYRERHPFAPQPQRSAEAERRPPHPETVMRDGSRIDPERAVKGYPAEGLLGSIIDGSYLFLGGKGYPLQRSPSVTRKREQGLKLNGEGYLVCDAPARPLAEIETEFEKRLKAFLQQQADEELPQRVERLEAERELKRAVDAALAQTPLQRGSDGLLYLYRDDEGGIVRWQEQWHIYLEVPEFVLEDPSASGAYYRFDATRVGMACPPWRPLADKAPFPCPVVLDRAYEHPYVGPHTRLGGTVCMGGRSGSHYDWSWWSPALKPEDALYKYLLDAKYVLLGGYHEDNPYDPTFPLETFAHRRISVREIRRRKLKVTNRVG